MSKTEPQAFQTDDSAAVTLLNEQKAMRVSRNSIMVNAALSLFKLFAGLFAHSGAMVSDAVHSASDVFSTLIVMVGIHMSGKAADRQHEYGHERLECVAAVVLAIVLGATGLGIGYKGVLTIVGGDYGALTIPGTLALVAAVVSILVKEMMFWYTRRTAREINSAAMMADAWHHRSDALSSIGSFVGVLGARLGFALADPIASVVICLFILKAAVDIFTDAVRKLIDESCDSELEERMRQVILTQDGVLGIDVLRTRQFGARVYLDVEICADGNLRLWESHRIAENVHNEIEKHFSEVKHCMVHVNPVQPDGGERENGCKIQKDQTV